LPMIQRGRPTNRVQRKRGREVFHAEHAPPASPEYLNWSETRSVSIGLITHQRSRAHDITL
jgi:hypothetical protein